MSMLRNNAISAFSEEHTERLTRVTRAQLRYWDRTDLTMPNEDDVLKVAAAWSVNPDKLEEMSLPPALGLLGDPSPGYYEPVPVIN